MKLAHISDLHFYHFPHWTGIATKRLIGLANLYIRGRIRHFHPDIARLAIQSVIADAPDGVIISGDLTALASPQEFATARQEIEPLLEHIPVALVPGNHDYYTRGAIRQNRIEQYFGDVIRTPGSTATAPLFPTLHIMGESAVIGLNPNHFSMAASGKIDPGEFSRLKEMLQMPEVQQRFIILVLHYPLYNQGGRITWKFWRRLANPELLLGLLRQQRIDLILHGHDHRRYNNLAPANGKDKPGAATLLANAGSAGYCHGAVTASYNLYRIENRTLQEVTFKNYRDNGFHVSFQGPPSQIPDLDQ